MFTYTNPIVYDAVASLPYEIDKEEFKTCFIIAKSHVAPLKKLTLLQLEFMNANHELVLG